MLKLPKTSFDYTFYLSIFHGIILHSIAFQLKQIQFGHMFKSMWSKCKRILKRKKLIIFSSSILGNLILDTLQNYPKVLFLFRYILGHGIVHIWLPLTSNKSSLGTCKHYVISLQKHITQKDKRRYFNKSIMGKLFLAIHTKLA